MVLILFFSVIFLIFIINLVHALKTDFFSAMPIFLKIRFNDPSASPRVAYVYGVFNGLLTIAIFPMYWMLAWECKHHFNGSWQEFAEDEVRRFFI